MQYMLLIYSNENSWTEQETQTCLKQSLDICEQLKQENKLISAAPLCSVNTATSIQVREGHRQVTDGPFAETHEQLGGYYIIDVPNLDDAIDIAGRLPPAKKGTVEIRPIQQV